MKFNLVLIIALAVTLSAFTSGEKFFSGRIIYKNSFTNLQGDDISDKLAPFFGAEQHYYISGPNYKAYNEKQQLLQLYTGANNEYIYFKDGQVAQKFDAAKPSSTDTKVTPLAQTATVLGHPCKAVEIVAGGVTTVYFYATDLKVRPKDYAKHAFGDWYTYLKATQGGLTLKYMSTNPKVGYVMTSEAASVQAMPLTSTEFSVTASERQ
ncbi:hypothetical protein [Hymenobacter cavernae]|uniref:GLPGLI family protein n=1 Tax=Hymenobacter cavernae TaxID=2044852 RepID=A0ABQ1U756_9BACT|nr:hypothetical protein [Hymenobacter cavernae]GGF10562.1 hypothetical protein GCM10011383_22160 [Hymenobacter cavernae]